MRVIILLAAIVLTSCSSNKKIIDYTQNNSNKLNAIKNLSYQENKNFIALAQKLDNNRVLLAINSKDTDIDIYPKSCKVNKKIAPIQKVYEIKDTLPKWLDRYYIKTNNSERYYFIECKMSDEQILKISI